VSAKLVPFKGQGVEREFVENITVYRRKNKIIGIPKFPYLYFFVC
jgi:hypothetical protein